MPADFLLSVPADISPDPLEFAFWRGDAPQILREHIQQFTKPGADGHGERKIGIWGVPVEVELESHHPNYQAAMAMLPTYTRCIGAGVIQVTYNNIALNAFEVGYTVQDVELDNATHARILQMGPGYLYPSAGILRTKWTITAVKIGVT